LFHLRLDRLQASAKELSSKTGQKCVPIQADVRTPAQLHAAAKRTVDELGKIDFVICGMFQSINLKMSNA
jgi:2,4-dienoyl-CoA reductase [(3E)-enoyl-CoA-producing], peroxisomal